MPFHNLTYTFILAIVYFFSNVSPKKLSWQNNILKSREAIRVLALPSAATETTEPMQYLLFPTLFATTLSCSRYLHRVKRGAVPAAHETCQHFALWWITRSLKWSRVAGYSRIFRRTTCSYLQGISLLLKQRRRRTSTIYCHWNAIFHNSWNSHIIGYDVPTSNQSHSLKVFRRCFWHK